MQATLDRYQAARELDDRMVLCSVCQSHWAYPEYLPQHIGSDDCTPSEDSKLAQESDPGVNSRPSPGFELPDTEEVH